MYTYMHKYIMTYGYDSMSVHIHKNKKFNDAVVAV